MARRATAIKDLRKVSGDRMLLLSGAYEFIDPDRMDQFMDDNTAPAYVQAFQAMGYDLVTLAPEEADILTRMDKPLPEFFALPPESGPQTRVVERSGQRIGLVLFPFLDGPAAQPSKELMDAIQAEAEALRKDCRLVIGLSPWPATSEKAFLDARKGVFDILLGSGTGYGLKPRLESGNRTVWTRPYDKGKALQVLHIMDWPAPGEKPWAINKNILLRFTALDGHYENDAKVDALFKALN